MSYSIKIEPEAYQDIQEGIDWYDEQRVGLGSTFYNEVEAALKRIKLNPFFQVRYDKVRCLPLKRYPYMIHFTIDEKNKVIVVRAVFGTSRNPQAWKDRGR